MSLATRTQTARLLESANVPAVGPNGIDRVELTRRLRNVCFAEAAARFDSWDQELYPALDSFGDVEVILGVEEMFDIELPDEMPSEGKCATFGDLVLFVENQLCTHNFPPAPATTGCVSQMAFYSLRRTLRHLRRDARFCPRPTAALNDCLPARGTDELVRAVARDFGVFLPAEPRVLGQLPLGATWLALSFLVLLALASPLAGGVSLGSRIGLLAGVSFLIACGLTPLSRPVLPSRFRTLGDVARHVALEVGA